MADFNVTYPKVTTGKGFFITSTGEDVYNGIGRISNPTWAGWRYVDEVANYYGKEKSVWNRITIDLKANKTLETLCIDLYKKEYWDKMMLSYFDNQNIATWMFDIGTFRGIGTATKALQTALNKLGHTLKVSGIMDNLTLSAVNKEDATKLYNELNVAYKSTVSGDIITSNTSSITTLAKKQDSFLFGGIAVVILGIVLFINNKKILKK